MDNTRDLKAIRLKTYEDLFSDDDRTAAFDRIANEFYFGNFGSMTKADFEVLMFDIYISQILDRKGDEDSNAFSDYHLSQCLGITQSKVSSLKVKKQLKYPRDYDWRKALSRASNNVRYEMGKIKLQVSDINVYYEVKNAIEEAGGFVDVSLTPKLLQVSPEYFLDLLEKISEDKDRDTLRKELRCEIRKHDKDHQYLETEPISRQLKKLLKKDVEKILCSTASSIVGNAIGGATPLAIILKNVCSVIEDKVNREE